MKDGSQQRIFSTLTAAPWYRHLKKHHPKFFFENWLSQCHMDIIKFNDHNFWETTCSARAQIHTVTQRNKGTVFTTISTRQILERRASGGCFLTPKPLIWIMVRAKYPRVKRKKWGETQNWPIISIFLKTAFSHYLARALYYWSFGRKISHLFFKREDVVMTIWACHHFKGFSNFWSMTKSFILQTIFC